MARARPPVVARWVAGLILCLIPLVLIALSPARADAALVYVGLLPVFVALGAGLRASVGTAAATAGAVFIGIQLSSLPLAGAVFMTLLGIGVVWSRRWGLQAPVTYVATQGALALVVVPQTTFTPGADPGSLQSALAVAALVGTAGLWVAFAGRLTLSDAPLPPAHREYVESLWPAALTLGLLMGVCTAGILMLAPRSNAWWILLTILVVFEPDHGRTRSRALQRSAGTIVGGSVAALVVVGTDDRAWVVSLGAAAAVASAVVYVVGRYSLFSGFLTMALVMLMLPAGRVLRGDLERVGLTVAASVLAVVVSAAAQARVSRRAAS